MIFEICSLCRFCCKIVQQNFAQVQKNAYVWLAVESLVQNEFWMFAVDPNGPNVGLCTIDSQQNFGVDPTVNELDRRNCYCGL